MKAKALFLSFGILFGFLLSRAGATTYDFYAQLFLFQDLQLLWVISSAVGVGLIGLSALKWLGLKSLIGRENLQLKGKLYKSALIPGSLIFGLGWGLAGACPGTVLAMLGEGKLGAVFTILGIVLGTYIYGWQTSLYHTKI